MPFTSLASLEGGRIEVRRERIGEGRDMHQNRMTTAPQSCLQRAVNLAVSLSLHLPPCNALNRQRQSDLVEYGNQFGVIHLEGCNSARS